MNENNEKWEILNVSTVEKAVIVPFTIRNPNYEIQVLYNQAYCFAILFWEQFQELDVKTINIQLFEYLAVYPSN